MVVVVEYMLLQVGMLLVEVEVDMVPLDMKDLTTMELILVVLIVVVEEELLLLVVILVPVVVEVHTVTQI